MKTFEGKLVSKNIRIGIVAARFNEFITSKLLSGALDGLKRHRPGLYEGLAVKQAHDGTDCILLVLKRRVKLELHAAPPQTVLKTISDSSASARARKV